MRVSSEQQVATSGMTPARVESVGMTRAWIMVAILGAFLLLSFVDRTALTVLVGPIKKDLGLSDVQMGLLLGTAFGVAFAITGPIFGYLIDRYNRRNLVIVGLVFWTLMTVLSGFAQDFATLFIARMGLGVGEAVLTPAAYSMIRDAFPEERRGRALGLYLFGATIGFGTALVSVGWLSHFLQGGLSFAPDLATWRLVLIIIGLFGLPMALLAFFIREPARDQSATDQSASMADIFAHVSHHRAIFLPLVGVHLAWGIAIFGYGSWIPTALGRAWDVPATTVGSTYGLISVCMAPFTILITSTFLDRCVKIGRASAITAIVGAASVLVAVPTIIGALGGAPLLTWICLAINIFFGFANQLALAVVIAQVTPGRMMGKMSGALLMALNLCGYGVGPILIPWVAGQFAGTPLAIGYALATVIGTAWVVFGLMLILTWRGIRRFKPDAAT